jgi:carbon storage regulator CsrA
VYILNPTLRRSARNRGEADSPLGAWLGRSTHDAQPLYRTIAAWTVQARTSGRRRFRHVLIAGRTWSGGSRQAEILARAAPSMAPAPLHAGCPARRFSVRVDGGAPALSCFTEETEMLVLSRKPDQVIQIGANITITLVEVRAGTARIGITAPREIPVTRPDANNQEPKPCVTTK